MIRIDDWRAYIQRQEWSDAGRFILLHDDHSTDLGPNGMPLRVPGKVTFTYEPFEEGILYPDDWATFKGPWKDVRKMLQAIVNAAYENGIYPDGMKDLDGELKATKFHLEDMRVLAKVKPRES